MSEGPDPVAAGAPVSPPAVDDPARASAVHLRAERVVVPPECACCGEPPSRSVREESVGGLRVLVPYCAACHAHQSVARTRSLSAAVSSGLVAVTVAAGLPLLWQPPSAWVLAGIASLSALAPLALARLRTRRAERGHAASGRAAFFRADGALVCASVDWGARLAAASQAVVDETRATAPAFPRWAIVFPVAAALAAVPLYRAHFPVVRIVNLTPSRISIDVDGRAYGQVDPTSAESVSAGVVARIPAGRRLVTVTDAEGRVVESFSIFVESGKEHLYAPGNHGACFRVETTRYGRTRGRGPDVELLPRQRTFWPLPVSIDYWFRRAPAADADERSSGGVSVALRQGPCEELRGPDDSGRAAGPRSDE